MKNYLQHLQQQGDNDVSLTRKIEYIKHNFGKYLTELNKKSSVLSIGPGIGALEEYMNSRGVSNIDLIDNDENVLNFIKTKFKVNNVFKTENIAEIKNKLQKYDAIFLIQVFEHIPQSQYKSFLYTLVDCLKSNGKIFIVVPNGGNPLNLLERYHDLQHVSSFTEDSLKELPDFCEITDVKVEVRSFDIPPYSIVNLARIFMQKLLHWMIISLLIINGGVYQKIMAPNITLIIKKKR